MKISESIRKNPDKWLEIAGLVLVSACMLCWLITNYSIRCWNDFRAWYVFGVNFIESFGKTQLGFGFPLAIAIAAKIVGPFAAFMINIPILVLLFITLYYFSRQHYRKDSETLEDKLFSVACGFLTILLFVALNKGHLHILANPLRDPLAWTMTILACIFIIHFRNNNRHPYTALATCAASVVYGITVRETTVLILIPLAIYAVTSKIRQRDLPFWKPLGVFVILFMATLMPYLIQNHLTTGNPLIPGQAALRQRINPVNLNILQDVYDYKLAYLIGHYSIPLLVFLLPAVVFAIRKRQHTILAISLPAVITFYFFYAALSHKIVWRYLLIIDVFIIPVVSVGIMTVVRTAIEFLPPGNRLRDKTAAAACITLIAAASILIFSGSSFQQGRLRIEHVRNIRLYLHEQLPANARIYSEGERITDAIKCFTEFHPVEIPERHLRTTKIGPNVKENTFLVHHSSKCREFFSCKYNIQDIGKMNNDKYGLQGLIEKDTITICRLLPWTNTTSRITIPVASGGKRILQVNYGFLSQFQRSSIDASLNNHLLDRCPIDGMNYYRISPRARENTLILTLESDRPVPATFTATTFPDNSPIELSFVGDDVLLHKSRLKGWSYGENRKQKYPVLNHTGGQILLPTLDNKNAVYIVLLETALTADTTNTRSRLVVRASNKNVYQAGLPAETWKRHRFIVEGASLKEKDSPFSLTFDNLSGQRNQKLALRYCAVLRHELTGTHIIRLGEPDQRFSPVSGIHKREGLDNTPDHGWRWTTGIATVGLLHKPADRPLKVQVIYLDMHRPEQVSKPDPQFFVSGRNLPYTVTTKSCEALKFHVAEFSIPSQLARNPITLLEIRCRTWVPSELGINNDQRKLGIMLNSIISVRDQ